MRWRVKRSVKTPTWFYACEVLFLDALNVAEAKRLGEAGHSDWSFEVWDITPATPAMEVRHEDWLRKCEEWRRLAARAEAPSGLL